MTVFSALPLARLSPQKELQEREISRTGKNRSPRNIKTKASLSETRWTGSCPGMYPLSNQILYIYLPGID